MAVGKTKGLMLRVGADKKIYLLGGIDSLHRKSTAMHRRHNSQTSRPRRNKLKVV